jgi:polyhydroxyalkanoate synthase
MTAIAAMPWMMSLPDYQSLWSDFCTKMAYLPKAMEVARKVRVGATPADTVLRIDKARLQHYVSPTEARFETPTLVVFALVNRPYILDLRPGKSVVAHFVNRGFDTYNLDWGIPSDGDRFLGMDDYIEGQLNQVVDFLRERHDCERINVLGYCMGGSMTAMYAAMHPDKVKNLIMLAAPVDWSKKDHLLGKWTDPSVFDVDKLIEVYGNAPAELLQGSFLLLKPVSTLVEKYFSFYENMDNEKFLEDFFAMETWLNDNIPVAGEMFRQFVKYCMQQNKLVRGELRIDGKRVDLRKITCPILNLVAVNDHLVPPELSLPFNDYVGSQDKESITFPAGHIGLAVGSKANRELWPKVADWLAKRSDGRRD